MSDEVSLDPTSLTRMPDDSSIETVEKQTVSGISLEGPLRRIPDDEWIAGDDFNTTGNVPNPYRTHPWVFAAIRAISVNIASAPTVLNRGSLANPIQITEESSGPAGDLFDVFDKPNDLMSLNTFWEAISILLNLEGMVFVVLDRNNDRQVPRKMMPVSRRFIEPVLDESRTVLLGWMFNSGRERIPLKQSQVVVVRFYNPDDPMMGLAPLEAAYRGVKLDFLADAYNRNFFENNADPGGFLAFDKRLTRKQSEEIVEQWEQRHRGAFNTRKIGILYGGGKYQSTGTSQRDMEYIKQREWNRSEILAVFKVPETEINMYQSVSFANATSQDRAFWTKTLLPIMNIIQGAFRYQLIRPLRDTIGRGIRLEFDIGQIEALQSILTDKVRNAQILYQIGVPINVLNKRLGLGLPKLPWGDMWFPNRSVAPIEQIIDGTANGAKPPGPSESNDPDKPEVDDPEDEDGDPPDDEPEDIAPEERRLFFLVSSVVRHTSRKIVKDLQTYLWRLRCHQLKQIDSKRVFETDRWKSKLDRKLETHFREFEENLEYILGEADFEHTYNLSSIAGGLNKRVVQLQQQANRQEEKVALVKNLFRNVRDEDRLSAVVCTELLTAAKVYCERIGAA